MDERLTEPLENTMTAGRARAAEHDAAGRHDEAVNQLARATQSGDIDAMTELGKRLVIGDRALDIDPAAIGAAKIDLGVAWKDMTGLPFVYAVWAGRSDALDPEQVAALQDARSRGEREVAEIARETGEGSPELEQRNLVYLRDTLRYGLGEREIAGLQRFHALAVDLGIAPALRPLRFFA